MKSDPKLWLGSTLLSFMVSCTQPQTSLHEDKGVKDSVVHKVDELTEVVPQKKQALINVFNHPLYLKQYKQKKRGANSSAITQQPYYYRPDTTGSYFSYFWFQQLRSQYPAKQLFDGLVIKTFIYGEEIGTYEDASEELIGIKSMLADPDLGVLDLVGKDLLFLESELGLTINFKEQYIIERHNSFALIIYIENQKAQWFNYLHTSLQPNVEIPEALLYFEEQVPKAKP
ncbi:MAG: hypothetical protein RH948_15860 [Cyclobacteriaceae bacterium]